MAKTTKKRIILSPEQQKSIALLVTRDVNKLTMQEIADEVGVSTRTLQRWRHNDVYSDELVKQSEEIQRAFLAETYVQLRALVSGNTTAENNRLKAIELVLKNQGRLKDVQEQTVRVEERSFEDLLQELDEIK